VEDDDFTRNILTDILNMYFKEVYVASDGKIGLELYKRVDADIVLSDIQMPNMGISQYIFKPLDLDQFFEAMISMAKILQDEIDCKKKFQSNLKSYSQFYLNYIKESSIKFYGYFNSYKIHISVI